MSPGQMQLRRSVACYDLDFCSRSSSAREQIVSDLLMQVEILSSLCERGCTSCATI